MFHTSEIFLSKNALKHNLTNIKNWLGDKTRMSSVVKGNAYGHGLEEYVPLAEECGVDHFSVFSAAEALRVFQSAKNKPEIMIMGHLNPTEIEWAIQNDIQFYVFEPIRVETALVVAQQLDKKALIHLEVETGMHRTGFSGKELEIVLKLINDNPKYLEPLGVCSHLAGAESWANFFRIKKQIKKFSKITRSLNQRGFKFKYKHMNCSAGIIRYPQTNFNLVRVGIMQFGFWPSKEIFIEFLQRKKTDKSPLKRVISWKSSVMSIKEVKTGEYIGYGTAFLAQRDMKIAIVPVGYSYGYGRSLSNSGRVLIRGVRAGVAGTVNMNAIAVDICDIDEVKVNDEVVLIGEQGDNDISVSSFSEWTDTLNYELLSRLPQDIPRRII